MNSHEVFIHIHQGCFAGTGAIVRLPQCQWSKPDGYGNISQCITTTKHSKARTVCMFLGIYCNHKIVKWTFLARLVVSITMNELDIERVRYHFSRTCHTTAVSHKALHNRIRRHRQNLNSVSEVASLMCTTIIVFIHMINTKITTSWAHKQFATPSHTIMSIF